MARYGDGKLLRSPVLELVQHRTPYLNCFFTTFTICFLVIKMASLIPTDPYTLRDHRCSFEFVMHLFCVYPGGMHTSESALNRGNIISACGNSAIAPHICASLSMPFLSYCHKVLE